MRHAVLERPGVMALRDRAEPDRPGPDDVVVAPRRVGICGTDHHAFLGRQNFFAYPRVLGHELAVEVVEVGAAVEHLRPGDRCAVLPYLSCGSCGSCGRGRANCCERIDVLGVTVDGGLSERLVVPGSSLFVGNDLSFDQLVLVETLGIGWHAAVRSGARDDDAVLIVGAGPIGLAAAQALRGRVERLLLADVSPDRVAFAAASGFETVVADASLVTTVRESLGGRLPTVLLDATGSVGAMEGAPMLLAHGGTIVFVGHTTGELRIHNPTFHAREIDLRASRNATVADWAGVMAGVRDGSLDAAAWINRRVTLAGIVDELPRLAEQPGSTVKAVVEIGDS